MTRNVKLIIIFSGLILLIALTACQSILQEHIGISAEQVFLTRNTDHPSAGITEKQNQIANVDIARPNNNLVFPKLIGIAIPDLQEIEGDKFVLGGIFTLGEGETLNGSLIVLGGLAELQGGSRVNGDVIVLGGTTDVDGKVEGEILVVGGLLDLGSTAVVERDVTVLAGQLEQDSEAQIYGEVSTGFEDPFSISTPGEFRLPFPGWGNLPSVRMDFNPLWEGLWILFRSVLWAAVAVLAILFLPKQTEQVGKVATSHTLISAGFGLLTLVVAPIILVVMIVTIIGIPVALLALFGLFIVWIFGVVALGTETGKRLSKVFNQEWSLAVSAGVGTFLLTLVIEGINQVVPCFGWIGLLAVALVGIGSVLLTRFGTQEYPRYEGISPPEPEAPQVLKSSQEDSLPERTGQDTTGDETGITGDSEDDLPSDEWIPEE